MAVVVRGAVLAAVMDSCLSYDIYVAGVLAAVLLVVRVVAVSCSCCLFFFVVDPFVYRTWQSFWLLCLLLTDSVLLAAAVHCEARVSA